MLGRVEGVFVMEDVEFYLRSATTSTVPEFKRASLQLATIAAMREVTAQLEEVKTLLKELIK